VIEAMLSMSGRVTMRGRSRWGGTGGSDRTIQRFCHTSWPGCPLHWLLIRHQVWEADEVVLRSGAPVVVTQSGQATSGWERCLSSRAGKTVPGRCCLRWARLSVKRRASYPVLIAHVETRGAPARQDQPQQQSGGHRGRSKGASIATVARGNAARRGVASQSTSRGCCSRVARRSRWWTVGVMVNWAIMMRCTWWAREVCIC